MSYAVGVPLGTWIGHEYGWRSTFWLVTLTLAAATLAVARAVPRELRGDSGTLAGLCQASRRADVASVLLFTMLTFTAIFVPFTYVGPMLHELKALSGTQMAITLTVFGCAGVVGTLVGGAASDRFGARRTLFVALLAFGGFMALLPLTRGNWAVITLVLSLWGAAGFGMMAPQQSRLAALSPGEAPMLLSVNTSMLFIGTALGAGLGGAAALAVGFARLPWVGLVAAALALVLLLAVPDGWVWRRMRHAAGA